MSHLALRAIHRNHKLTRSSGQFGDFFGHFITGLAQLGDVASQSLRRLTLKKAVRKVIPASDKKVSSPLFTSSSKNASTTDAEREYESLLWKSLKNCAFAQLNEGEGRRNMTRMIFLRRQLHSLDFALFLAEIEGTNGEEVMEGGKEGSEKRP